MRKEGNGFNLGSTKDEKHQPAPGLRRAAATNLFLNFQAS